MIRNDTLAFLLPLLSIEKYNKNFFLNNYFIGAFIEDVDKYKYEYEVILAYKLKPLINYHEFEIELRKHPYFSKISYDYEEDSICMFVFKIPIEYEEDYDHIMNGEYFKIDSINKLKISKFWNSGKNGKIYKLLFNYDNKEKWSSCDFEKETFDITEFNTKY